jgi:hypothetical protein
MAGLVATILFVTLMNSSISAEDTAVEQSLAQVRAYWAEAGHQQYAMSRIRFSKLCNNLLGCGTSSFKDTEKVVTLQSYLDEISSLRTFTYADENANYRITVSPVAAVDDNPARQNFSGHLMITSTLANESTVPVLSGMAGRASPLRLRLCVGLSSGGTCGPIGNNNGGVATENISVKRLARQPSP